MKKIRNIFIFAAMMFVLTSCIGKTTYEKFHKKASEVKDHEFISATISGTFKDDNTTSKYDKLVFTYNKTLNIFVPSELTISSTLFTSIINVKAKDITEMDNTIYSASILGYRVSTNNDDNKVIMEFNTYGLLTSYKTVSKDGNYKLSIRYSK